MPPSRSRVASLRPAHVSTAFAREPVVPSDLEPWRSVTWKPCEGACGRRHTAGMTLPDRALARSFWSRRRTQPEWLLLPLRVFLGVTFTYAGLQKLSDPGYLDPNNPTSAVHQMLRLQGSSPIGPLLSLSAHAPTLVSLVIALAELAVGLGTLLGLWARVAAAGGALPCASRSSSPSAGTPRPTTTGPTSCSCSPGS